ncbi:maleylpyruvate isomerase family mycothiol-dependent enzyme [Labedaea rhizosphaerae]|uniref:Maleylpyruvate isomerase n=1 Tax=Labedaea rhizosphaerae TaxID=598644 RepID=A0A4R6RTN2_LABRH|nr:maleylpyruvate isomerase family mycothiol-dependent enzyme [Labedaea rhizosphaerae]TDP89376.1 maleylpyruvate isomerase [Labedaea rhizosphaerae]
MAGSSISPGTTQRQSEIPPQRTPPGGQVAVAMKAVRMGTELLTDAVAGLDEDSGKAPSLLPGWTRAHVMSHLARNADALVNLLTWARTGIEHQMYASKADRDADIEEGAQRLVQVIKEDLLAAGQRFEFAVGALSDSEWSASVGHHALGQISVAMVPMMRQFEVCVHMVDLDLGIGFDDLPPALVEPLLGAAARPNLAVGGGPVTTLRVELADGGQRTFELMATDRDGEVSGPAGAAVGWLTGRTNGAGLTGELPDLAPWR